MPAEISGPRPKRLPVINRVNMNFSGYAYNITMKSSTQLRTTVMPSSSCVAAEEQVVLVPDPADDGERDGKGGEPLENALEIREAAGDLDRDHQQRQREAEDRIAEALDTGDLSPAQHRLIRLPEVRPLRGLLVRGFAAAGSLGFASLQERSPFGSRSEISVIPRAERRATCSGERSEPRTRQRRSREPTAREAGEPTSRAGLRRRESSRR